MIVRHSFLIDRLSRLLSAAAHVIHPMTESAADANEVETSDVT
jgi:hypothetical protein